MIEILYEDAAAAVCVKPAGMAVEGAASGPCLVSALGGQLHCPIFPVHRLDLPVGGVMVFAKTKKAAAALCRSVEQHALEKEYLAAVAGTPDPAEGELRDWLFHDARANKTFLVKKQRKGVREAVLRYRTLDTAEGLSLVRVQLLTGRTHQIRAQFAGHAHPLAGDGRYGSRVKGPIALWSTSLRFPHPESDELLHFEQVPPEEGFWTAFSCLHPKEI